MSARIDQEVIGFVERFGDRLEYQSAEVKSALLDIQIAAGLDGVELPKAHADFLAICEMQPVLLPTVMEAYIENMLNELFWNAGPLVSS